MSDHANHPAAFSEAVPEDLVQYKRISLLAVAALLGGLLSPTALTSPFMWWLPLVTIAVAAAGLTVVSRRRDVLMGRKAALVGLWLALLSISIAVTHHVVRHQYLYRAAQPRCEKWLRLIVDGRVQEAHQLQMNITDRRPPGIDLDEYYEHDEDLAEDLDAFTKTESIKKLMEIGSPGTIRHSSNEAVLLEYFNQTRKDVIVQRYRVDYQQDGQPETLLLETRMERKLDLETGEIYWRVIGAETP